MVEKFRYLEHTADALFQAQANDLAGLFVQSAIAMCNVAYDLKAIKARETVAIKVKGKNKEELLHNFLGEILFQIDSKQMLFSQFKIIKLNEKKPFLHAHLIGEKIDKKRHKLKTEIKAVTWHQFFIKKEGNKFISQVLLDI